MADEIAAIIVAAGRSERMGGDDKLWHPLTGHDRDQRPLLAYSLDAYQRCAGVGHVVLVVAGDAIERAQTLVRDERLDKVRAVVAGGARRRDSVRAGLDALPHCAWVVVHDGARPLVTPELIESGLLEAENTGASCCAVPAHDTVKDVDDGGYVARTLDRSRLWLAQTPQVFAYDVLVAAHRHAPGDDAPDDASMVEAMGVRVRVYPGSRRNVKVTTPEDLAFVLALLMEAR